ncbi:MAG: 4-(cytidine 5'-diphospho)-2-C-methyl-D-erythritol kinase [Actinobacteria bacterium]|nr:4-(cytidine 5'-diphospho)-2-C-methyl-D-erythritol kinase [Actinomycetota bacterium]
MTTVRRQGRVVVETAPAKVNLILQVGPRREDGLHRICSLFASVDLADTLRVETREAAAGDEVRCPGVEGPNLVTAAIDAYRRAVGGALPPLAVEVDKRVPVAAGLGGGSADAAAALRAANRIADGALDTGALRRLAFELGADVPSQLDPAHALVEGAGERVEPLSVPDLALVLVSTAGELATADVYAEADRLGCPRAELDPESVRAAAAGDAETVAAALENDLEPATLSLRPELEGIRLGLLEQGALGALVSGSGPTVFGLFREAGGAARAASAIPGGLVARLRNRHRLATSE